MDRPAPPLPRPDDGTRFFWEATAAGRLELLRCNACGTFIHLPRPVCRNCRSFDLSPSAVSGKGTVYTFTETHRPFHPYFAGEVPYLVATIELAEQPGLMFLSNLVDIAASDVRIGMPVEATFRPLGDDGVMLPVFRPVTEAGA